jgi:Tol biopolymer transport system component
VRKEEAMGSTYLSSVRGRKMVMTVKRLIALMTVAGMTLLGLVAVSGPTQAMAAGSNGQILFLRNDPATDETHIFTANPDGSHEVQLPPLSADAGCPSWSPDGTKILENTGNPNGVARPATVNPDGSGFKLLDNPDPGLFLGCGNWSPDMARISSEVFGVLDPGRNGIYTMRSSDGRGLFRVTTNPGGDDNPWGYSPDGSKILFGRTYAEGDGGLFVVNSNGTGLHRLNPPNLQLNCCSADWSLDGARVVFAATFKSSTGSGSQSALFVVNADGTGLHQLTPDGLGAGGPQWSPDGQLIVFNNLLKPGGPTASLQIYVVHPNGSGLKRITDPTNGDGSFGPVWSPDSTKLLFSRVHFTNGSRQEDLWMTNADGTDLTQVTNTPNFEDAAGWGTHPLAT